MSNYRPKSEAGVDRKIGEQTKQEIEIGKQTKQEIEIGNGKSIHSTRRESERCTEYVPTVQSLNQSI